MVIVWWKKRRMMSEIFTTERGDICAFCNKNRTEVKVLVKSDTSRVCICDECTSISSDMIREFNTRRNSPQINLMYPNQIRELLDKEIIGQDDAKQTLSVAAFMHILRIISGRGTKSNVLMVGPTGSGKTRMMQVLAEILQVPLAITDATTLTEAGYVGDDVESIVARLIQIADFNMNHAKHGIIYIDEIDKLARTSNNRSISRDVSGEGVQQALLKLIEGTVAMVPQKTNIKHPSQDTIQIDTKDILFICGGSFEGITRIIKNRMSPARMGIGSSGNQFSGYESDYDYLQSVDSHDFMKFGMIPEFIGRLPIRVVLKGLTIDELVQVITQPKSAIFNQYEELLSSTGVGLTITDGAKLRIAQIASAQKTGARGIRSVIEKLLTDEIYREVQEDKVKNKQIITIDVDLVNRYFK